MVLDPIVTFVLVLLIGIAAGVIGQRGVRTSWLSRRLVGGTRADMTSALVGIAGAFIGFHLATLVFLSGGMIVLLIGAIVGAALVICPRQTLGQGRYSDGPNWFTVESSGQIRTIESLDG